VPRGKPNSTLRSNASLENMIGIVLHSYQEIVESLRVEGTITTVDPTLYSIFFCFRSVYWLKQLFHPACRGLCLLKVELFGIDDLFERNITIV